MSEKVIRSLSIDGLREHPRQRELFRDLDGPDFDELVESMGRDGQIYPIEVTPDNTVIDGHQRVRAARLLGWGEIWAWVRDDLDAGAVDERHIAANVGRRQLDRLDRARLIRARMAMERGRGRGHAPGGDLRDRVAREFGMDGRTAQRWVNVLGCPMPIQAACSSGRLPITLADRVSRLPAGTQGEIAAAIAGGADPVAAASARLPKEGARPAGSRSGLGAALDALESALDRAASELAAGATSPGDCDRLRGLCARSRGLEESLAAAKVAAEPVVRPGRRKPLVPIESAMRPGRPR